MNFKRLIKSTLVAMTAATIAQLGVSVFAADDLGIRVQLVEGESSVYGEEDVREIDEFGVEYLPDLIPDADDLCFNDDALPSSYDLRDYGLVTSIKNQSDTSTCWAHSALSAAESALIKDGYADISVDLSEAHLVWFAQSGYSDDINDPLYGDGRYRRNLGSNCYDQGGNIFETRVVLGSWIGAEPEANYPNVVDRPEIDESYRYNAAYHLQNAYFFDKSDRDTIKNYLMSNGALTISYYHNNAYKNYTAEGGTAYYNDDYTKTNHAVTLIGWDDNYSASNFKTAPEGDGAWLIKNSWGEWSGDDGCFWMSYYDTSIDRISSMEMEPADNYSGVYHYAGSYNSGYYSNTYGAAIGAVFTSDSNDPITAVSFVSDYASTPYEIRIYSGAEYGKPMSGTLVHTQTGTLTYSGLNTVKLSKDVNIPDGTNFFVAVHINKAKAKATFDDYSNTSGRCFYGFASSLDNVYWYDTYTKHSCDVVLNVFRSKPVSVEPKATAGDGYVALVWDKITGAEKYAVYTYTKTDGYKLVGTTSKNAYVVSDLTNGTSYGFLVRAYVNGAWSAYTKADNVYATPMAPSVGKPVLETVTAGDASVSLVWSIPEGASRFAVYTYTKADGYKLIGTTSKRAYVVSGLTNGTAYGFLVRAYGNGVWSEYTKADLVYATPVSAEIVGKPEITTITPGDGKMTLIWSKPDGAIKYAIYSYTKADGYTLIGTTSKNAYIVSGLTNGTAYGFLVRACGSNGVWSEYTKADNVYATPTA